MNCAFEPIDEYRPDGRQKVRCKRCGHVGSMPRTGKPADNLRTCKAAPDYWLAVFIHAFAGEAIAVTRFLTWKARGSKLEELPPEIPRPALPPLNAGLSETEVAELFPEETDPTLIGNRIKALTEALGIPHCGGCDARRKWLNAAHEKLREWMGRA
jgi:hypothetical protein